MREARFVFDFMESEARNPVLAGGKGCNLAKLSQAGFPVPEGVVVASSAYSLFIEGAVDLPRMLQAMSFDNPEKLLGEAEAVRRYLDAVALPEKLRDEMAEALRGMDGTAYSVRSSSTLEDLAGAAFAGQHDTYLNCIGEEEILRAIKKCFISLWHDRAISYRHARGFAQTDAAMAVVVQKMIFCDIAGVGFSVDPIGGRDAMLINSNYGLGESVVSGMGESDQFVVSRSGEEIVESLIGSKTVKVVPDEESGQGTKEVLLAGHDCDRASLDPFQIRKIASLMLEVERYYRFPQDIEWGIMGGRLYLLQARPITSIAPRWTRDESAERYPNAMTPLSWDLIEEGFHKSMTYSFQLMGFPPFDGKWFALFDNYVYGNQNAVRFYLGTLPFVPASADELRAGMLDFVNKYGWALDLPSEWMRGLDRYLLRIGELRHAALEGRTPKELWAYVVDISLTGGEYFRPNIAISITQAVLYRSLLVFMKLFARDEAQRMFDKITSYCETKTSLVNRELGGLAEIVRADDELRLLFREVPSRELAEQGMLARFPEFAHAFARFLDDHGHREVDFDPYIPTWAESPWIVLDNVKLILSVEPKKGGLRDDIAIRRAASEAETAFFALLPDEFHLFFREIIRLVRLYTELDDVEHYQTTRLHPLMRRGLRTFGEALRERGVVEDPMDVFFAEKTTVDACAAGEKPWEVLTAQISGNKAAYLRHRDRSPAWVLGDEMEEPASADEPHLKGLAGSPGVAEGTVFVVASSEDFAAFPKGAVLVARTTNPAWTPLFYAASALVTESGGPLSHGAVTAREMKIPAVMSVRKVLETLQNGDMVRVDGTRGVVWRL